MAATMLGRLWGRDADYLITDQTELPEGAHPAVAMDRPERVLVLLRELVEAYPGNLEILRDAMQRTAVAADSDPVQTVASRVAAGFARLWCFPHPRPQVPRDFREIPRLADLAERQSATEVTTWIGVRVVDQYGRPLPWMRSRLGLPDGRVAEKRLDAEAHTGVERMPQSGMCWLELQAEQAVKATGPFVDAVEPPRPVAEGAATWIGVRVVDQYGRPLPWMQARLELADGSERRAVLDGDAVTRVDSAVGGRCVLELQAASSQGALPS